MTTRRPAWAEATLRRLDIPISDNAVAAAINVIDAYEKRAAAERREPSEEEKRAEEERQEMTYYRASMSMSYYMQSHVTTE